MNVIQVRLRSGNKEKVSWIDKLKSIKVGSRIKLTDYSEWWEVVEMYSEMDKKQFMRAQKGNKTFGASII